MIDLTNFGDYWRAMYIDGRDAQKRVGKVRQVRAGPIYDSEVINSETWRRKYACFEGLPPKTQFAVSALMMCANTERIVGVGQKVSTNTFWIDSSPEVLAEYDLPEYSGGHVSRKGSSMDEADKAQDDIDMLLALHVRAARGEIPVGVEGECDSCGELKPRLIDGMCARCRDRQDKMRRLNGIDN